MSSNKIKGFDHRVLHLWREKVPPQSAILMAVSGGVDSLVMADFLWRWQKLLGLKLRMAYVHHGAKRGRQGRFRDQAQRDLAQLAKDRELPFFTNTARKNPCESEASLRDFRWRLLREWAGEWAKDQSWPVFICTGHTAEDQLETQLLRLVRGSGPYGMKAMSWRDDRVIRPFLRESKEVLKEVAKLRGFSWHEDPSNQSVDPLRNWLRRKWLKPLQERFPEGVKNMARSLENILSADQAPRDAVSCEGSVSRQELLAESRPEQRRILAQYLRQSGIFHYTQAHLDEILKRLDTGRRELRFQLLGRRCEITSDLIVLRPE